jgi:S1-C subfamily serine protease
VVTGLYRNSPAVSCGIQPGDVFLKVGGQDVRNAQDAQARMSEYKPGSSMPLQLQRGQKKLELKCQVIERPTGN